MPEGGSPDRGNVRADGKWPWLFGRYADVVYELDTTTGVAKVIPLGKERHGLTAWSQPGRYFLRHTGNMRWSKTNIRGQGSHSLGLKDHFYVNTVAH